MVSFDYKEEFKYLGVLYVALFKPEIIGTFQWRTCAPCSLVSTVAMDVGEAAMTQHLESVSVNRDISLIATGKLVTVVKKSFYVISSMKLITFLSSFWNHGKFNDYTASCFPILINSSEQEYISFHLRHQRMQQQKQMCPQLYKHNGFI